MGFYSKHVFPRLYDLSMNKPFWAKYRRHHLETVQGEILEIGAGSGLNLPHYPDHIRRITSVDPNPGMNKRLLRRAHEARIELDQRVLSSEKLPFDDASFDSVVSTLTMCSIPDVKQAMAELFRVLKPGGRILFFEHGISPDIKVARWQRRMNWLQKRIADGCSLTLDVGSLFATQPFQAVEFENFYVEKTPRTRGYIYQGVATK